MLVESFANGIAVCGAARAIYVENENLLNDLEITIN